MTKMDGGGGGGDPRPCCGPGHPLPTSPCQGEGQRRTPKRDRPVGGLSWTGGLPYAGASGPRPAASRRASAEPARAASRCVTRASTVIRAGIAVGANNLQPDRSRVAVPLVKRQRCARASAKQAGFDEGGGLQPPVEYPLKDVAVAGIREPGRSGPGRRAATPDRRARRIPPLTNAGPSRGGRSGCGRR